MNLFTWIVLVFLSLNLAQADEPQWAVQVDGGGFLFTGMGSASVEYWKEPLRGWGKKSKKSYWLRYQRSVGDQMCMFDCDDYYQQHMWNVTGGISYHEDGEWYDGYGGFGIGALLMHDTLEQSGCHGPGCSWFTGFLEHNLAWPGPELEENQTGWVWRKRTRKGIFPSIYLRGGVGFMPQWRVHPIVEMGIGPPSFFNFNAGFRMRI